MEYYVITFVNTHSAITMEKLLKKFYNIVIMPTPREISRGCGIAIRFSKEDYDGILERLEESSINRKMYSVFQFTDGQYSHLYNGSD